MEEYVRSLVDEGVHQSRIYQMVKNKYPQSNRRRRNAVISKAVLGSVQFKKDLQGRPVLIETAKKNRCSTRRDLVWLLKQLHPLSSRKLRKSVAHEMFTG